MLKWVLMCRFRVDYALSREQKNKKGGKMYIQDKVEEYADEVFDLLDNGAHIYFCGLKGMMPGTAAGSLNAAPLSCLFCICFSVFVVLLLLHAEGQHPYACHANVRGSRYCMAALGDRQHFEDQICWQHLISTARVSGICIRSQLKVMHTVTCYMHSWLGSRQLFIARCFVSEMAESPNCMCIKNFRLNRFWCLIPPTPRCRVTAVLRDKQCCE